MRSEQIFPTALIVIDLLASVGYMFKADWRMATYWTAAATLTACVTFTGGAR